MYRDWSVNIVPNRINELVSIINHELDFLHSLNLNIYDTENPEWRIEKVEYDASADKIFFKCELEGNK